MAGLALAAACTTGEKRRSKRLLATGRCHLRDLCAVIQRLRWGWNWRFEWGDRKSWTMSRSSVQTRYGLMPIMLSPSLPQVWCDWLQGIHSDYGTMEDFKKICWRKPISEISRLWLIWSSITVGVVILGLRKLEKGRDNPYRDYYVWAQKGHNRDFYQQKSNYGWIVIISANGMIREMEKIFTTGFFIGGIARFEFLTIQKFREGNLWTSVKFWLEEIGVDGFRLRCSEAYFPDDRPLDNHAFWKEFRAKMGSGLSRMSYLVGEV